MWDENYGYIGVPVKVGDELVMIERGAVRLLEKRVPDIITRVTVTKVTPSGRITAGGHVFDFMGRLYGSQKNGPDLSAITVAMYENYQAKQNARIVLQIEKDRDARFDRAWMAVKSLPRERRLALTEQLEALVKET